MYNRMTAFHTKQLKNNLAEKQSNINNNKQGYFMTDANKTDSTTKMAPKDINQDGLAKEDQQRTDDSALDMMQGLHEHENHEEEGK